VIFASIVIAAASLGQLAPAAPENPTIWTWEAPRGRAASLNNFVEMIRLDTATLSPARAASEAARRIVLLGLGSGQVVLVMEHFGNGMGDPGSVYDDRPTKAPALTAHVCDGLPHRDRLIASCERTATNDVTDTWWATPWMSRGIDECRTWMEEFTTHYRQRQTSNPAIPDPSAVLFLTEPMVGPDLSPRGGLQAFEAIQDDPRYQTHPIPGFGPRTLGELYALGQSPPFDTTQGWYHLSNQTWTNWYASVVMQATEAALARAVVPPIKAAWPDALISNGPTARAASTPLADPGYRGSWRSTVHARILPTASPMLTGVHDIHRFPSESWGHATARFLAAQLEEIDHDRNATDVLLPWVDAPGSRRGATPRSRPQERSRLHATLGLLRDSSIPHMLLWSDDHMTEQDWDDLLEAMIAAYGNRPIPQPDPSPAIAIPHRTPRHPRRLIDYHSVGLSAPDTTGRVSSRLYTSAKGWRPLIDGDLRSLTDRLGDGSFDLWLHNTAGVWPDTDLWYNKNDPSQMRFDQVAMARRREPGLIDMTDLSEAAQAHDIGLYGYIGYPLTDAGDDFAFAPVPEHGDPAHLARWYEPFLTNAFLGVGHDWTTSLPPDSPWLSNIAPALRSHGIDPIIEAVPWRRDGHLLGYTVVAEERRWHHTQKHPETFFTEEEINAAGGATIHLITWPPGGMHGRRAKEPGFDRYKWRFETALALLNEGKTVAVPLGALARKGFPVERLAHAAGQPTNSE
jgi:hypothetical protein